MPLLRSNVQPQVEPTEQLYADEVNAASEFRTRGPAREFERTTEEARMVEPDELRDDGSFDTHDESNLLAPLARSGKRQRWVRVINPKDGTPDLKNWIRALRDGYAPRPPETIRINNMRMPSRQYEGYDVYMCGHMVLMEIDDARFAVIKRRVDDKRRLLNDSTRRDHERESKEGVRAGMSPIEREEEVTSTNRPPTMA